MGASLLLPSRGDLWHLLAGLSILNHQPYSDTLVMDLSIAKNHCGSEDIFWSFLGHPGSMIMKLVIILWGGRLYNSHNDSPHCLWQGGSNLYMHKLQPNAPAAVVLYICLWGPFTPIELRGVHIWSLMLASVCQLLGQVGAELPPASACGPLDGPLLIASPLAKYIYPLQGLRVIAPLKIYNRCIIICAFIGLPAEPPPSSP